MIKHAISSVSHSTILKDGIKKEEHTNHCIQVTNVNAQRHIKE